MVWTSSFQVLFLQIQLICYHQINLINYLKNAKKEYDCIVIDSAPCLLVSDTFEISDKVDSTLYVVRANHTENIF